MKDYNSRGCFCFIWGIYFAIRLSSFSTKTVTFPLKSLDAVVALLKLVDKHNLNLCFINKDDYNAVLSDSHGNKYYMFVDAISYYYKVENTERYEFEIEYNREKFFIEITLKSPQENYISSFGIWQDISHHLGKIRPQVCEKIPQKWRKDSIWIMR